MTIKSTSPLFRLLFCCLVVFCCSRALPGQGRPTWNPKKTWVFLVCLLEWQDSSSNPSFPTKNRKDVVLVDRLRRSGVPEDQILYLADRAATTASVKEQFDSFLKKAAPDDWVLVYFAGHGYKTDDGKPYLATYDVSTGTLGWAFEEIPDAIEKNFVGSHAVIALDNCYSGAMANAVKKRNRRVSYAVLASSLASQESTGNWTFTESLISAFSGSPIADANHDGVVSMAELGRNSEAEMLFVEEQVATIAFTGSFDPQIIIAKAAARPFDRFGDRVEAFSENGWYKAYLIDKRPDSFKVHFYGYDSSEDQWVPVDKIRSARLLQYAIGSKVLVEWKKKWYAATVVDVKGGSHFITYTGYGREWDEWVATNRIKPIE